MKKIKRYLNLTVLSILSQIAIAQPLDIEWQNTIGGNTEDRLYTIEQTTDGGYIIGGKSNSAISGDKTETPNGGAGQFYFHDFWIVKLNSLGTVEWEKTIGGGDFEDELRISQSEDGSYFIAGTSNSNISADKTENSRGGYDFWILKLDALGNILWDKTIGGDEGDFISSFLTLSDGYLLYGTSSSNIFGEKTENSNGFRDYWVVRVNLAGDILWQNTIGGDQSDYLISACLGVNSGFLLAGYSSSGISGDKTEMCSGTNCGWVVKISDLGIVEWDKTYSSSSSIGFDQLSAAIRTADDGYVLAGESNNSSGGWIMKINLLGGLIWERNLNFGVSNDKIFALEEGPNGEILIGGQHGGLTIPYENYYLALLTSSGQDIWQHEILGDGGDVLYDLHFIDDNKIIVGGTSSSGLALDKTEVSNGTVDYWVLKLGLTNTLSVSNSGFNNEVKLFPNPVENELKIELSDNFSNASLSIVDLSGKEIYSDKFDEIIHSVDFTHVTPGVYLLNIVGPNNLVYTARIIK